MRAVLALGLTERGQDRGLTASAPIAGEGARGWNERAQSTFSASAIFSVSLRLERSASVGALFSPKEEETPMDAISPRCKETGMTAMGARRASSSPDSATRSAAATRRRKAARARDALASAARVSKDAEASATREAAKARHRVWMWIASVSPRVCAGKAETGASA